MTDEAAAEVLLIVRTCTLGVYNVLDEQCVSHHPILPPEKRNRVDRHIAEAWRTRPVLETHWIPSYATGLPLGHCLAGRDKVATRIGTM